MMYIPIDDLEISEAWRAKAKAAFEAIQAETDKSKRSKLIDSNDGIWKELREAMRKLSLRKCWYSEAPQSGASQDVDHYRPKGRVYECKNHEGYWWLAFDPSNFRLSCTYCNQRRVDVETAGGKWDHFPLFVEADRCLSYASRHNLNREHPLLLDPCDETDIDLLYFDEDGQPAVVETLPDEIKKRIEASIDIYHLRHDSFVKGRKAQTDLALLALDKGKEAFNLVTSGDATQKPRVQDAISSLRALMARDKPYTAAVRSFLMGQRSHAHPWIERALAS